MIDQDFLELKKELKQLIIDGLFLEDIEADDLNDDESLFGEGLGLDSLDAVEIVSLLQRNYGIEIKNMEQGKEIFSSINTLAKYVNERKN